MIESTYRSIHLRDSRLYQLTIVLVLLVVALTGTLMWNGKITAATGASNANNTPISLASDGLRMLNRPVRFQDLYNHPDKLYPLYLSAPINRIENSDYAPGHIQPFRDFLNGYVQRQALDDNFTIRVTDNRSQSLLEEYSLDAFRNRYRSTGHANWGDIDALRASATNRLVSKHVRRGIPSEFVTVRWGRLNQVTEARERELPFIQYEVKLSQYLGLSLLTTEIGTVETFNIDSLISSVGARGRYQIMPGMLKRYGIRSYTLPTRAGSSVQVKEEVHPLLSMVASFRIVRGYANAVGHEIPGISAYHTGPFNIMKLYSKYLKNLDSSYGPSSTVMDAYMWALTEGFDEVSDDTGFRRYSRGYIPSAYGALKATENMIIDPAQRAHMDQLVVAEGESMYLGELLEVLEPHEPALNWSLATGDLTLYERFAKLNPHFKLPGHTNKKELLPAGGDVRLRGSRNTPPVRLFLPPGSIDILQQENISLFADSLTFAFNENTFTPPSTEEITPWDTQYQSLVLDIGQFGFNEKNFAELTLLKNRFEELAEERPSYYRETQLSVINLHHQMWRSRFWKDLSYTIAAAKGRFEENTPPSAPITLTPRVTLDAEYADF